MGKTNDLESMLDQYYDVILTRNDVQQRVITPDYVEENRETLESMVELFIAYPDYLIDIITPQASHFSLFFYQRVFARVCMRYQKVSGTFPRAYSKSYTNFMVEVVKAILYPRSNAFLCAATKEQASSIGEEKTVEIFGMFPFLVNELKISQSDRAKKKYGNTSDGLELFFKNESEINIVGSENARGKRRHRGTLKYLGHPAYC